MQHVLVIHADEDEVFSHDAFRMAIGLPVPISMFGKVINKGKVLAAEVSEDGKTVEVTIEGDFFNANE